MVWNLLWEKVDPWWQLPNRDAHTHIQSGSSLSCCHQYLEALKGSHFYSKTLSLKFISLSLTLPVHHTSNIFAGMQETQLKSKRCLDANQYLHCSWCESFKALKNVHIVDLPISFLIIFPKKITRGLCKDWATRTLIVELFYNIKKINKPPEYTAIWNL